MVDEMLSTQPEPLHLAQAGVWLGAPATFGLALPDAQATRAHLYGPRGVWLDDQHLIVCDSGNHRVLIWNGLPSHDHAPADVVLGQPILKAKVPPLADAVQSVACIYPPA